MTTPTPSLRNFSAHAAASGTRPMVESAMTHCTGVPSLYLSVLLINPATFLAISMVCSSNDSRTPP